MNKKVSKKTELLFRFFPCSHLLLSSLSLFYFFKHLNFAFFALALFSIYLLPLLVWRLTFLKVPEGQQKIGPQQQEGSTWLISHYLQYNFIAFPFLERVLIVIPGAFSVWLRLWGSRVGKKVIWTPNSVIYDRSLLEIEDYAFIGDFSLVGAHILKRKDNEITSVVKKIKIGEKSIVGANSNLGPGTELPDHTFLPSGSRAMLGKIERRQIGKTTRS